MENKFDLESFLFTNRYILITSLVGLILVGVGAFYVKRGGSLGSTKVEVLSGATEAENSEFVVEVSGAVENPGVYKVSGGSRIEDALVLAGGLSADADRIWVEKTLNRAAKISDGQKIYIPSVTENSKLITQNSGTGNGQSSLTNSLTNINTASLSELDKLPGIGPVYGQSIIDHRPYSTVEELVSKGAIKQNVFEKIKDKVSVY